MLYSQIVAELKAENERLRAELRGANAVSANETQQLYDEIKRLRAALEGTLLVIDAMRQKAPEAMGPGFQKWRDEILAALANEQEGK
jgi:phage/plasmid-associated DNA primase